MSYILDALRKAEQGRNKDKAPALFAVQTAEPGSVSRPIWPWIVIIVLTISGALLFYSSNKGWLGKSLTNAASYSGQAQSLSKSDPSLPEAALLHENGPSSPLTTPSGDGIASKRSLPPVYAQRAKKIEMSDRIAKKAPARDTDAHAVADASSLSLTLTTRMDGVRARLARQSLKSPPTTSALIPTSKNTARHVPRLAELPSEIQLEIPKLVVAMHMYSDEPSRRLASVNNKPLHEGDELSPDLKLVEIVPDGLVFSYRGHQFKKGIN